MIIFYVRNTEEFEAAVKNSSAGDTIYLASGDYHNVSIRNLGELDIKITSLDPENPAVITELFVSNVSGIEFSNIELYAVSGKNNVFTVFKADDISFDNVTVHGPDNLGSGDESSPMLLRESTNISVTNSEFYNVQHGVKLLNVDGVFIDGNSFHDVRTDGVRGGGVSNAVISNNHFTDFYPADRDHPDAIQLWSTNQSQAAANITISNNLVERGDGEPIQGIFIRDTFGNLPFENVTITDNVVLGGLYNGIAISGVVGGTLSGNFVAGYEDQRSWIRVNKEEEFEVSDNAATAYSFDTRDSAHFDNNAKLPEEGRDYREWSGTDISAAALIETFAQEPAPSAPTEATSIAPPQTTVAHAEETVVGSEPEAVEEVVTSTHAGDAARRAEDSDAISGETDNVSLIGNASGSIMSGGSGNDKLFGKASDDLIFGGAGNDLIIGGAGADILTGGEGNDRFAFRDGDLTLNAYDTITDFISGQDLINLRQMDADTTMNSDQNFTFVGQDVFSGKAGELNYSVLEDGILLAGDVDGDGVADFFLKLDGIDSIGAQDFWL